jgi:peptidyl-prolyl cis-trans isomerase D
MLYEDLKRKRRKAARTVTAWALFSIIILVFVFWGMSPRNNTLGGGGAAAEVNNSLISLRDVSEAVERLKQNPYFSQMGDGEMGRQRMQQMAVQQLVQGELAYQGCVSQGFWSPDAEIAETIRSVPVFNEDGKFHRERYMAYLQNTHQTAGEFEEKLRRDEIIRGAQRVFRSALQPSIIEVEKQQSLAKIKTNIEFVNLPTTGLVAAKSVSAADVKAFLDKPDAKTKVEQYYAAHPGEFSTPEEVHARHILIKADHGNPESEKKAYTKAKDVAKRAQSGKEEFAKLAKDNSEDPGSKDSGGDLGFFSRGKMVPEFEKAVFSMESGKVSEPVRTQYGYHVIQVLEKHLAQQTPIDSVREKIAGEIIADERSEQASNAVKDLLKKGDGAALNAWVQSHGLKWEETGAFGLDSERIPKIGENEEFAKAAFALNAGHPLADMIIRQGPSAFILRYKAIAESNPKASKKGSKDALKDAAQKDADAALMEKPEVMQEYLANQRSQEAFQRWISQMAKSAKIVVNKSLSSAQNEAPPDYN